MYTVAFETFANHAETAIPQNRFRARGRTPAAPAAPAEPANLYLPHTCTTNANATAKRRRDVRTFIIDVVAHAASHARSDVVKALTDIAAVARVRLSSIKPNDQPADRVVLTGNVL